MNKKLTLCVVLMVLFLSGCAGIFHGTRQTVTFTSEPEGAQVLIDGKSVGVTPLSIKIGKNDYDTVMFKKKGYTAQVVTLETSYDAVALLNIFWDLSTTDLITGAAYEYDPNMYHVILQPKESISIRDDKSRQIHKVVLGFGDDIRLQLSSKEQGDALGALVSLIARDQPGMDTEKKIEELALLAEQSPNNLVFAQKIVAFYSI